MIHDENRWKDRGRREARIEYNIKLKKLQEIITKTYTCGELGINKLQKDWLVNKIEESKYEIK